MTVLFLLVFIVIVLFGMVVLFGAPYLPTLRPQIKTALELLDLKPGSKILELGCGDGKVLMAAAEQGYEVVGVELNPLLALVAWARTRKYGKKVRVIWGNFWRLTWPESDAVYVFLLDRFMPELNKRMEKYGGPLVSIAFAMPTKTATKEKNGVFLYRYKQAAPANHKK